MSWGSLTYKLAESTNCRLQTIVFRVRKQWNYCCHVVICMVKTVVCSSLQSAFCIDGINWDTHCVTSLKLILKSRKMGFQGRVELVWINYQSFIQTVNCLPSMFGIEYALSFYSFGRILNCLCRDKSERLLANYIV